MKSQWGRVTNRSDSKTTAVERSKCQKSCVHRAQLTGLSAPLFLPLSCSVPPSRRAPGSDVLLSSYLSDSLPASRITDSTPGICGLPALTFLSCSAYRFSAPCRFRRLVRGPRGPSENCQGSDEPPPRLTVTSDIRHLAVPHTHAQQ